VRGRDLSEHRLDLVAIVRLQLPDTGRQDLRLSPDRGVSMSDAAMAASSSPSAGMD
jgi:hypothetical protein